MSKSAICDAYFQMGDRVGPVGTVETESSGSALTRLQSVNQSINQDRQEALVRFDALLCTIAISTCILCPPDFSAEQLQYFLTWWPNKRKFL